MTINGHNHSQRLEEREYRLEANLAFDQAVATGRLSDKPSAVNYLGNYMYMGKGAHGKSLFKHIITRQYID